MVIDKAQNITIHMMQSKKSGVEAESEETELKSSNNQLNDDRQGKLKTWKVKTRNHIFFCRKVAQLLDDSDSHNYRIFIHGWSPIMCGQSKSLTFWQVTSKMASLACTPQGFPYLRCSGFWRRLWEKGTQNESYISFSGKTISHPAR